MEKAKKKCLEMLQQRGYTILDTKEETIDAETGDGEPIRVFFINSQFNAGALDGCLTALADDSVFHAIVVYDEKVTPPTEEVIKTMRNKREIEDLEGMPVQTVLIELFKISNMQTNPTKHKYTPKHTKVEPKAAKEYKKKYGSRGPTMLRTDPIACFFGFRKGDLIRIERPTGISYRVVC